MSVYQHGAVVLPDEVAEIQVAGQPVKEIWIGGVCVCRVKDTPQDIPCTAISISAQSTGKRNVSFVLTAILTPGNTTDEVSWQRTSGPTAMLTNATRDTITVTATGTGVLTIKATCGNVSTQTSIYITA